MEIGPDPHLLRHRPFAVVRRRLQVEHDVLTRGLGYLPSAHGLGIGPLRAAALRHHRAVSQRKQHKRRRQARTDPRRRARRARGRGGGREGAQKSAAAEARAAGTVPPRRAPNRDHAHLPGWTRQPRRARGAPAAPPAAHNPAERPGRAKRAVRAASRTRACAAGGGVLPELHLLRAHRGGPASGMCARAWTALLRLCPLPVCVFLWQS